MFKLTTITTGLLAAVLMLGAVPETNAQGINFGFQKNRRGKSFGLNIGFPTGNRGRRHVRPIRRPICPPVHRHSSCCRQWVPGQVRIVHDRVWVPGAVRQVWVQPVYRTQYTACGNPVQILVRAGYHKQIQDPGHYEVRERRIQGRGHWRYTCGH